MLGLNTMSDLEAVVPGTCSLEDVVYSDIRNIQKKACSIAACIFRDWLASPIEPDLKTCMSRSKLLRESGWRVSVLPAYLRLMARHCW